ncbi:hypothetical protein [Variovorax boronicumulans]|uniref:hypothetical protein n=1 Tax=Variovorax boronicumulans TaxID=436515 RepID=UPI00117D0063|nr:hypothetical protein [Variovorax boronicumulans]
MKKTAPQHLLDTRRSNVLALREEYQAQILAAGGLARAPESAFAKVLLMHPSMWSQIKTSRAITDLLARKIEIQCGKPIGWLDRNHGTTASAAEDDFLDLARRVWRAENFEGKQELRSLLIGRERKSSHKARARSS